MALLWEGHPSQDWSQMQTPSRQTLGCGWGWHTVGLHTEWLGKRRKSWQKVEEICVPALALRPVPSFNPPHLHSPDS